MIVKYLNLVALLWNYPPLWECNPMQVIYLAATLADVITNTVHSLSVYNYLREGYIYRHYKSIYVSHIWKSFGNSVSSYTSMVAVYGRQSESVPLLLFASFVNHYMINYAYYTSIPTVIYYNPEKRTYTKSVVYAIDALYNRTNRLWRQVPHIIDILIISACVYSIHTHEISVLIHIALTVVNICMLFMIYFSDYASYDFLAAIETCLLCGIIT